jgi:hypothetical protein
LLNRPGGGSRAEVRLPAHRDNGRDAASEALIRFVILLTCHCKFRRLPSVEGGLMIDLMPMKGIHVDPDRRRVRAQGGVTWAEFNRETQLQCT